MFEYIVKILSIALAFMLLGFAMAGPAVSAEPYRKYAERLVGKPPSGVRFRPDLESKLSRNASAQRKRNGRSGLKASNLLRTAARAQAIDILRTNRVGHVSKRGDRFTVRFSAFAGDEDRYGIRGENALRSRSVSKNSDAQARHMMKVWLGSTGHRRNLMARDHRFVSTGVIQAGGRYYAVQMFWAPPKPKSQTDCLLGCGTLDGATLPQGGKRD